MKAGLDAYWDPVKAVGRGIKSNAISIPLRASGANKTSLLCESLSGKDAALTGLASETPAAGGDYVASNARNSSREHRPPGGANHGLGVGEEKEALPEATELCLR